MESSSDDDVPLSQLAARAPAPPPAPPAPPPAAAQKRRVEESEDEWDEPISAAPPAKKAKPAPPATGDDDSDDSDDVPLAQLRKPAPAKPKPKPKPKPKKPPSPAESDDEEEFDFDKPESSGPDEDSDSSDDDVPLAQLAKKVAPKKKAPAPKKKTAPRAAAGASARSKKQKGGEAEQAFYETLRGQLLQQFLRRWWYAVDWPSEEAAGKLPEEGFERLEGFPGVHICTQADNERLGEVMDHRDHATSPCFVNYYTKPSAELKQLCLKACEVQMAQLLEAEPANDRYISKLKADISEIKRVDTAQADREAAKAVQQYQKA